MMSNLFVKNSRIVVYLSIVCCMPISLECTFGQDVGAQAARQIVATSTKLDNNALQTAVDSFCSEIEKIENSTNVRVTYSQMSPWRKDVFRQEVMGWIEKFPHGEVYQTETILKAHNAQHLVGVTQLYIVPPLKIDQTVAKESITQLNEVESILREGVDKKLSDISNALTKKYPVLGNGFSLGKIDDFLLMKYAPLLEDDLNYKLRYPLESSHFDDIKNRILNVIEKTNIDCPDIEDGHISELAQLKKEGKIDSVNSLINSLKENIKKNVYFRFSTSIQKQCNDIIDKAYGDVVPSRIINDYRRFGNDIERLVDTSVVKAAFEEHWRISQEQIKKWHDERKSQWDMIVAEQPRGEPIPDYELPEPNRGKLGRFLIVNGIIITVFVLYYFLRWRFSLKHKQSS